jgi:hypothetical protein
MFEEMFGLSENSMATQCPTCKGMARKIISAPYITGIQKGRGGFQFHIDRPRPLEECKRDAKKLEESGNMGPDEAKMLELRISRLQAEQDAGILDNSVDYQVDGHPLEKD